MFGFLKNFFQSENRDAVKTISDLLEKRSKEIETGEWIAHAIVSADGLTVYSKVKNKHYNVDRLFPYGVKIFDTVAKFHEKSKASLKDNIFKQPEVVVYRTESMEEVFILKNRSAGLDIYLIWICDPTLTSAGFSTDKMMVKLSSWLKDVSVELRKMIERRKEKYET
ncbi:hypothetical protein [Desulfurobacterium atlanticum]|uniref:Uncharacterized protein n=1 Tax=Desulfurobacterium atlanticum TaxID=240169 RepID=A0A238YKU4_9BACT|nr:hypothetical protein [Desulfurobacterium atlanticum]SNR71244.1 hypothetical protein SAMN06265340_103205 [Desulfurobacterium atlanticum]